MKFYCVACFAVCAVLAQTPKTPAPQPSVDDATANLESLLATKVVTASRFAENLADAPGVMRVVRREEIDRFGGLTLREVLNRVSGLSMAQQFTDRTLVVVRGDQTKNTSSHVLFLINGRPVREVIEGGIMTEFLESFPLGIVERIEVIEGPGSVLYGSNAFSGVINVITKTMESNAVSVRGFGSGAGPDGGSAEGWFHLGKLNLSGAAQFHRNSPWSTQLLAGTATSGNQPPRPFTLFDSTEALFTEAHYGGLSAVYSGMRVRSPFDFNGSTGVGRWRRTFVDLGYDRKLASRWDMGLHATYTGNTFESTATPIRRRGGEVEIDWTNSVAFNERTSLTFGALYNYQHGRNWNVLANGSNLTVDATRPGGGFYAQFQYRLADGLNVIGGFQSNKVENIALRTVPRLGAMWNPFPHWHVKALYGQAFRAPSLNEINVQHPTFKGNPNLLPETASTFDLAALYQSSRLETQINYFRTRQSNIIQSTVIGPPPPPSPLGVFFQPVLQYNNATGLLFHGFQWDTKWYIRRKLLAEGSALYQTNTNAKGEPGRLASPSASAKAGLSYADHKGWTLGLFDVYTGLVPGFASTLNPKPAAYHMLTANVRIGLEKYFGARAGRVALFAHGDNLVNRPVWQPFWGYGNNTTKPGQRGITVYYGVEIASKRE